MGNLQEPLLQSGSLSKKGRKKLTIETESLSYDPPTNRLRIQDHKEWQGRRHLYGYTGHTAVTRVSTILSGILIGVVAVMIQNSIEHLVVIRNRVLQHFFEESVGAALFIWLLFSIVTVVLTGALVQIFAPKAAGAGVTLVMAFLNGADIRGLLSIPVFIMKFLGLICSRVAGLAVGPEGPMVHLGACVASMLCACEPRFMGLMSRRNQTSGSDSVSEQGTSRGAGTGGLTERPHGSLQTASSETNGTATSRKQWEYTMRNADHRELVSAGAAAGIAAAFGAPIGGVLFSLEEAATHWSRKIGWSCFLCTTCASFTLAQLHPRAQSGMLSFKADNPLTNRQWLLQAPFVILVSICGGLLGSTFNILRKKLWPIRASRKRTGLRLAEAACVAAITVILIVALAHRVGRCLPLPEAWDQDHVLRLSCPKGHYNDLGSSLMGSDVFVIRTLLNLGSESLPLKGSCNLASPCYFSWPSLAVLSVAFLVLMALASSICVPGGLFMPSIMVGGAFGALFGFALREILSDSWDIRPGVYALLCGTAVLGGVFRSTFSLVVIVVEGTKGIDFLFGIIMAIVVSNLVANKVLSEGVYESELERDGNVYYLRPEPPYALKGKTASDIMATPVVGLEAIVPVSEVRQVLEDTTHNGFPIYSTSQARNSSTGMGGLNGFILRSQLQVLLERRAYCSAAGDYISNPSDVRSFELSINKDMRAAQQTVAICTELVGLSRPKSSDGSFLESPCKAGLNVERRARRIAHPTNSHDRAVKPRTDQPGPSQLWLVEDTGSKVVSAGSKDYSDIHGLPDGEDIEQCEGGLTPLSLTMEDAAAAAGFFSSQGCGGSLMDSLTEPAVKDYDNSAEHRFFLNLAPYMERAPLVVQPDTLGTKVHHLFVAMSLRHLCVVDTRNTVLGIITRKDLDHAAGEGWWRINKLAPEPHHGPGLRRHQSWLAISMSAPRRLLSSIQAALSPIASPLASLRGTPGASPCGTPRSLSVKSRAFTCHSCDVNVVDADERQPEAPLQTSAKREQDAAEGMQSSVTVPMQPDAHGALMAEEQSRSRTSLRSEDVTALQAGETSEMPESHLWQTTLAGPSTSSFKMGRINEETELAVEESPYEQQPQSAPPSVRTLVRRQSTLKAFGSVAIAVEEEYISDKSPRD